MYGSNRSPGRAIWERAALGVVAGLAGGVVVGAVLAFQDMVGEGPSG